MTAAAACTVAAVRDQILDASNRSAALRVTGNGTWLDAGRPVRAQEAISTSGLSGIVEYVPGDLTLTALAGTTLGEIRDAAGAHGQWLALDPFGVDEGTIGATIATASAGPLFTFFGRPRDLVLGLEFVTGNGTIARGGGRVVKNVAGFDLTRLMTGSWGTLGVITEAAVRLHARPVADESIAISLEGERGPNAVGRLLRRLPFVPYACEVVNGALAEKLTGNGERTALVRMGGNAESVRAQRAAFTDLGNVRPIDAAAWQGLRRAEPGSAIVFRLSRVPSEIDLVWEEASAVERDNPGTMIHASPARGIVRCIVPADSATAPRNMLELFRSASPTRRIGERLTPELWAQVASPAADALPSRVRHAFDSRGVLNPGMFGDVQ